jgi:hypothetical protein
MTQSKYIIKTKGSLTIVRLRGRKGPGKGSTSAPPWEEIRHLFENLPDVAPKPTPKPKSQPKRRKKKR